ncbi:MAG: porin [Rhodobacteraceae bacterium]|nr:porin [Paracoccaceae bacterium]
MKNLLLASTALVLSAGFAAAAGHEGVSVGGNGYMGILDDFGSGDAEFKSRIRITFDAVGTTDAGLEFGGSVRADNASGGASGTAGSVYVSGTFGKFSMGDVDGAALAAVGDLAGVGYEGIGDLNEMAYLSRLLDVDESLLYSYSSGDLSFYASHDQLAESDQVMAVGVSYDAGNFSVALGVEDADAISDNHIIIGVGASLGDVDLKAIYGDLGSDSQFGVSASIGVGETTITAFWEDSEELLGEEAFGIGAAYDLGGGATLAGGYVSNETTSEDAFDLGIKFSF